jgi:hypothetical protein
MPDRRLQQDGYSGSGISPMVSREAGLRKSWDYSWDFELKTVIWQGETGGILARKALFGQLPQSRKSVLSLLLTARILLPPATSSTVHGSSMSTTIDRSSSGTKEARLSGRRAKLSGDLSSALSAFVRSASAPIVPRAGARSDTRENGRLSQLLGSVDSLFCRMHMLPGFFGGSRRLATGGGHGDGH